VGGALPRDDARPRGVDESFRPCGDVRMVAFGVYLELLPKVCIERCKAMLAVLVSNAALEGVADIWVDSLLEGIFMLQNEI